MKTTILASSSMLFGALPAFAHHEHTLSSSTGSPAIIPALIIASVAIAAAFFSKRKLQRAKK